MKLVKLTELYPGGWDDIARNVKKHREGLWGVQPDIPPVDLAGVQPPPELLQAILAKNRKRVRNEITTAEMTADGSPYQTDEFFDDQLVEVIDSIEHKYRAEDFIAQLIWLVRTFGNESAALRGGRVEERLGPANADAAVGLVKDAFAAAKSKEEKLLLDLLAMDMSDGGEAEWIAYLGPEPREFLDEVLARQQGGP
jgi:hypothetical protein